MNPNIDIYTYNSNVRGVFKSLTDFGIILEKEHLDYLQPKATLTTTVKNCLTNNTGFKSVFVYSMLDDYAFAYPAPDANVLNNKLTYLYNKIFAINPKTNWLEFWDAFSANENVTLPLLTELSNDWNNPDIVKPTLRFKKHAKINGIYNQAKTAANFKQYLQNFEPTFSVAHLMFDIGPVENTTALAETTPPENYWIKIIFNQDKNWNSMPKIVIADTFMHEMIHAEIFRKFLSLSSSNGNIDVNLILQYLNTHNYPGLFDYYIKRTKGNDAWQHEAMGAHYVTIMVNFLKQIYGTKYTDVEYKTIVWMGLEGTTAWNLLPQSERHCIKTLGIQIITYGKFKKNINISDITKLNFSQKSNYKN